jgi:hypothetical protein
VMILIAWLHFSQISIGSLKLGLLLHNIILPWSDQIHAYISLRYTIL